MLRMVLVADETIVLKGMSHLLNGGIVVKKVTLCFIRNDGELLFEKRLITLPLKEGFIVKKA